MFRCAVALVHGTTFSSSGEMEKIQTKTTTNNRTDWTSRPVHRFSGASGVSGASGASGTNGSFKLAHAPNHGQAAPAEPVGISV